MDEDEILLEQEVEEQPEQQPEKTFTQAELDKIVGERLARAKTPEDYEALKQVAAELEEYGYPQSPKEILEMIKTQKAQAKAERELEELEEEADKTGMSPEILKEIKELKSELKELKSDKEKSLEAIRLAEQEQEEKAKKDAQWDAQLNEMTESHPDVDLEVLAENSKFLKFVKGKTGTLKEFYEDFIEFVGETESEAIKKAMSKAERSTSSGKATGSTGTSVLNEAQKKTLAEWNRKNPKHLQMTEKEFLGNMNR